MRRLEMDNRSSPPPHVIAAHHEAGHGVGAVLLGVPIKSISIEGEGSGDGSFNTDLTWGEVKARGIWREHAVVCELGRVAEQLLFGTSGRDCWKNDEARIAEMISKCVADEAERGEVKIWLRRKAWEVAEQSVFVAAVRAVAQELAAKKSLSGWRVEEIVRLIEASSREVGARR
jgi:hypothetical protein